MKYIYILQFNLSELFMNFALIKFRIFDHFFCIFCCFVALFVVKLWKIRMFAISCLQFLLTDFVKMACFILFSPLFYCGMSNCVMEGDISIFSPQSLFVLFPQSFKPSHKPRPGISYKITTKWLELLNCFLKPCNFFQYLIYIPQVLESKTVCKNI